MSSVVALTVSFGLGMSATIHFLNRLRLEERSDETIDVAGRYLKVSYRFQTQFPGCMQ